MEPPVIATRRLTLRAFIDDDIGGLVREITGNPQVMALLPQSPRTVDEQTDLARLYAESYALTWESHGYGGWAICARDEQLAAAGALLGFVGLSPGQVDDAGPEFGLALGRSYWDRGVASEAGRACIEWYLSQEGHDCIHGCPHPRNLTSIRLIEGLGFRREREADAWNSVARGIGLLPVYILRGNRTAPAD